MVTDMNEVILKADRRGRLRYTKEHKQALIEAYESSGLSGPRFAALQMTGVVGHFGRDMGIVFINVDALVSEGLADSLDLR